MLFWYQDNMKTIERVQTGVRLERRILKVLKSLAETLDLSLGDLLEGIVLHAFEGKTPFGAKTLEQIEHPESYAKSTQLAAAAYITRATGSTSRTNPRARSR